MDNDELTWENIRLLKIGRHFRIGNCKLVIGRNNKENNLLREYSKKDDYILRTPGVPGPTAILRCKGEPELFQLETAAGIVARYSDAKEEPSVEVAVEKNDKLINKLLVKPIFDLSRFAIT